MFPKSQADSMIHDQPQLKSRKGGMFGSPALPVLAIAIITLIGLPLAVCAQDGNQGRGGQPQQWDPADFLQRLDRDGNGYLDSGEMSGRSGRFIERLGFDTSGTVSVESVIQKIESDRGAEADKQRRQQIDADRKVPKFGEAVDLPPVPGFGDSLGESAGDLNQVLEKHDEETSQVVAAYLERYDENNDGFLAGDETRRVGRILGDIGEADTDDDGRLSPMEMAEGYKLQRQRRTAADNGATRNDDRGGRDFGRGRGDFGRDRGDENREIIRESSPAVTAATSNRSISARASSYVDGVFKKYDTNNDGNLSAEERTNLRVPFTDPNSDGIISRDEAVAYVSGSQKSGGSISPAAAAGRSSSGEHDANGDRSADVRSDVRRDLILSGRTLVPSGQRSSNEDDLRQSGASDEFVKLDRNGDGQLQMAEFSNGKEFTEALYEEFLESDANGDGVITPDEHR